MPWPRIVRDDRRRPAQDPRQERERNVLQEGKLRLQVAPAGSRELVSGTGQGENRLRLEYPRESGKVLDRPAFGGTPGSQGQADCAGGDAPGGEQAVSLLLGLRGHGERFPATWWFAQGSEEIVGNVQGAPGLARCDHQGRKTEALQGGQDRRWLAQPDYRLARGADLLAKAGIPRVFGQEERRGCWLLDPKDSIDQRGKQGCGRERPDEHDPSPAPPQGTQSRRGKQGVAQCPRPDDQAAAIAGGGGWRKRGARSAAAGGKQRVSAMA